MELIEEWRPVVTYESRYQVSSLGRVRSLVGRHGPYREPKLLRPGNTKGGYLSVSLHSGTSHKTLMVHRLVAQAFCSGYSPGLQVNHKNGIRHDNRPHNLEWVSCAENQRHSWRELGRVGSSKGKTGADHHRSIPLVAISADGEESRFSNQREAARILGVDRCGISACINGRQKQVKGYTFYVPKSGDRYE